MEIFHGSRNSFEKASVDHSNESKPSCTNSFQMSSLDIAVGWAKAFGDGYVYSCDTEDVDIATWAIAGDVLGEAKFQLLQGMLAEEDFHFPKRLRDILEQVTPATDLGEFMAFVNSEDGVSMLKALGYRGFCHNALGVDSNVPYYVFFHDDDIPELKQARVTSFE